MNRTTGIPEKAVLTEADLWRTNTHAIWRADTFEGRPHFYPIYRWRHYYSYSPFLLARLKGRVNLNPLCGAFISTAAVPYCPPDLLIDSEIHRLGKPLPFSDSIKSREEFLARLSAAMINDVNAVEERHPGHTNFILCGGKDSLNGLLLNWRNPVVALSAEPNFELVREFIRANGLRVELVKLSDYLDEALLDREVAENFCRIDPQHGRWSPHLAKLAREAGGRAIFWTGFMGDFYLSPNWMKFTASRHPLYRQYRKRYRAWMRNVAPIRKLGWQYGVRTDMARSLWTRGAAWQGAILGLYRSMTDCLTLSLYHGAETSAVLHAADLSAICFRDVRPALGHRLSGRELEYPRPNPGPPPSAFRAGLWSVPRFIQSLERFSVPVIGSA